MGKAYLNITNSYWNLPDILSIIKNVESNVCIDLFRYCGRLWIAF